MLQRPTRQRFLATAGVILAVLAGAAALYATAAVQHGSANPGVQTFASGSMSVRSSSDGAAIFDISNIAPGLTLDGEVTIDNNGTAPGSLVLASADPSDDPGLYGGEISTRLDLRVADVTAGRDTEVYSGALFSMPELQLGALAAGEARTYRFLVTMRDGGSPSSPYVDDNLYQRASASLTYNWTLTGSDDGAEPPTAPPAALPDAGGNAPPTPPHRRHRGRTLIGDPHPNLLVGSSEDDRIYGLGAADSLFGRGGDDYILGGAGSDRISGGPGNDRLRGGVGPDHIFGGPGSDVIFARDGMADVIDCGPGSDKLYFDVHDRMKNCESLYPQYGRLFPGEQRN